jgi:nucleotide-binding universal stress UspA family protein
MAETVLCAVDDSDAARQVFETARGLADASGTGFGVVHVRGGDGDSYDPGDSVRARLAGAGEMQEVRLVAGDPSTRAWRGAPVASTTLTRAWCAESMAS